MNSRNSSRYEPTILIILGLVAAIPFLGRNRAGEFDITGFVIFFLIIFNFIFFRNVLITRELSIVGEKRSVSRFSCIVDCLRYENAEIIVNFLIFFRYNVFFLV